MQMVNCAMVLGDSKVHTIHVCIMHMSVYSIYMYENPYMYIVEDGTNLDTVVDLECLLCYVESIYLYIHYPQ